MRTQVLIIGLDGATFSVLDPLMQSGVMPRLRDFVASGVRAELKSVVPALTPPAWTSLMTGRAPGRHGIFDFFRRDSPTSQHIRFQTSADIGCDTLWTLADRAGLRSTVLNFPMTFPVPRIDGYVVAGGWMPWRQLRLGCHPAGLYDRLAALPGFNPRELAMDMTHEEKALEGCRQEEYRDWIDLHIRRERRWAEVAAHLMRNDATELVAVLFDGVDKLQHLCWRFIDPTLATGATSEWDRNIRDRCLDYFREVDAIIAELLFLAGEEANIVVVSDHGFGSQIRTFFVNAWLQQRGCLAWADDRAPRVDGTQLLGMGRLAKHVYELDWLRTKAYAPMPSGNGIHIVRADRDHPGGVPEDDYEAFRERLIEGLLALEDPSSGEQVVARVWKREDVFDGPYLGLAPDLTLELTDGGLVSILGSEDVVRPRPQPTGTHRPNGVFAARGPRFRQGACVPQLSILNIAPLVLYGLGLPIPSELDEELPFETLREGVLLEHPVSYAAQSEDMQPASVTAGPELGPEAEMEIMKRLRALGYVE
ncbi:MAG: phosphodiesterase [Luteitalea sp.]|nr:phosphodiesterase [Luteitalea sp.]